MDDLSQKIEALLHSPEGMEKLQAAMAALGTSLPEEPSADPAPTGGPDLSRLLAGLDGGGLGELAGSLLSGDGDAASSPSGMPDLSRLLPLIPLLSGLDKEDDNTALLRALRPHLHGDRGKRVDEAIRMMKIMKLMPLLSSLGKGDTL